MPREVRTLGVDQNSVATSTLAEQEFGVNQRQRFRSARDRFEVS